LPNVDAISGRNGSSVPSEPSIQAVFVVLVVAAALQFLFAHTLDISLVMATGEGGEVDLAYEAISQGSLQRRVGIVSLGLLGTVLLVRSRERRLVLATMAGLLWAGYVIWSTLSFGWAAEPSLVFRRLVAFWMLLLASYGVLSWAPRRSLPWFIGLSALLYVVAGVCVELVMGTFQPLGPDYRFAGTLHPNSQGTNCALLVLFSVWISTDRRKRYRWLGILLGAAGMLFLLLSKSRTSFAATVGAGLVLIVLRLHPRRRWILVTAGVNLAILVGMMYANGLLDAPLELLMLGRGGEDVRSLNSRLPLWLVLSPYVEERPIIGFGYSGFMTVEHAREIALYYSFGIAGAHSLYLETLLGTGVVGLGLLLSSLLAAFWRQMRFSWRGPASAGSSLFAAVLAFELLNGVLEHTLVFPSWRFPSLLVIMAACLTQPFTRPTNAVPMQPVFQSRSVDPVDPVT
jgi:O-antigen ligase